MNKSGYWKKICVLLLAFVIVFANSKMFLFAENIQQTKETQTLTPEAQQEEAQELQVQKSETQTGTEDETSEVSASEIQSETKTEALSGRFWMAWYGGGNYDQSEWYGRFGKRSE